MCKYFTSKKSEINPNDVEWIEDTESGWSACSEACAGGRSFSFYFLVQINDVAFVVVVVVVVVQCVPLFFV